MKLSKILTWILFFVFVSQYAISQESNEAYLKRMQWWDEGRLGMFLHWGVYSTYGGEYNSMDYGKEMGQASAEWIYLKANIPKTEYQKAAMAFNAAQYNPREWARMAKSAGMKYIVLTAKHHDGFALFDSKASDWNAVRSSGAKRDLFKEYVEACREEGMKVGFYFSHEKDWFHHARLVTNEGDIPKEYVERTRKQITELLTQYGKIDLIWFDTPVNKHEAFNKMCADLVRQYQPDCILNGRIGNGLGDYKNIGDREIVGNNESGYYESIMTMRLNWGFDKNDDYWKSSAELIRMVSISACRGSNFLLNIGPTPEGTFPIEDQVRLKVLGDWMEKNGAAIYNTTKSPFPHEQKWGSATVSKESHAVYLHLWNWQGGDIVVKGINAPVTQAMFLDTKAPLRFNFQKETKDLTIALPEVNMEGLRIVKLEMDALLFTRENVPAFELPKIEHVTHKLIKGKITVVDGTTFTLVGKMIASGNAEEYFGPEEVTMSFALNDHVRFRASNKGDIRLVQGFQLEKGKEYAVVFSPFKTGPEVEIIMKEID